MEDKEENKEFMQDVVNKLTPYQKRAIVFIFTIGTFALMITILVYIIYNVQLLSTHPCELCYDLNKYVLLRNTSTLIN